VEANGGDAEANGGDAEANGGDAEANRGLPEVIGGAFIAIRQVKIMSCRVHVLEGSAQIYS
jgi:hypothetical protein